MGIEVVGNKDNLFSSWIQGIGSVLEYLRKIQSRSGLCHNSFSPAGQRFGNHEYIRHPVADIYRIHLFGMARFTRDTGFFYKLFVRFVYADNGAQRIIRTLVNLQYILHFCHKISISLRNAPFFHKPRLDFVFFITSQMVLSVM